MNYKEKIAEAHKLFEQAKTIMADSKDRDRTAEEEAQIEKLMKAGKKLQLDAENLKQIKDTGIEQLMAEAKNIEDKGVQDKPKEFKTWREFCIATYNAGIIGGKTKVDERLVAFKDDGPEPSTKQSTMVEGVGASGGFLVPTEFRAELMGVVAETALVRGRATVLPMTRRQLQVPVLDQTGTTAGIPHWFGGMQFFWAEEATEKTLTEAAFRQISLVAHKLIGYTRASDELLDDSAISLSAFLAGPLGMAGGIAWMEDFAFISGSGAGQPLGVINAGATITVARAATLAVSYDDLTSMVENFLPSGRGVWFYTQSGLAELMRLSGPAANPSFVWQPSARDGVPDNLFGMPAIRTEKVPVLGTAGDFILADWSFYLIGDRQATTLENTQFDRWRFDETSWRAVHRVDGQPWLSAPLTLQDSVTQVSPFVILGDKST